MPPVPDRDRWLALVLLAIALVVAYLVFLHPWWTAPMRAADARIQALQDRQARAAAQLAQAGDIRRSLQAARSLDARTPVFLPEASVELATAALAQRLEMEVERASPGNRSCAISGRVPAERPQDDARYPEAGMHVRLRCGNAELAALLHALENGHPSLFVDNLNVTAQGFFHTPEEATEQDAGLDVEFDLYGYLRPEAGATSPGAGRAAGSTDDHDSQGGAAGAY